MKSERACSNRVRRLVAAAGLVLALVSVSGVAGVLVASPASAHSALTSSSPAEGATVTAALDQVELTFTEAPLAGLDAGLRIEVRNAAGVDESTGDLIMSGTTMSKAVALTDGAHTVLWRYLSPDGHPIDGQVNFTYNPPAAPSAAPTTTATETPDAAFTEPPTATAVPVVREAGTPMQTRPLYAEPVLWVAIVVVAGIAAFLVFRRRGQESSPE